MTNKAILSELEKIKKEMLVLDIETSALYPGTDKKINISTNFEDYVKYAKVKWVGMYSYKFNLLMMDTVKWNEDKIRDFIAQHEYIISFNSEEFDAPIMYNNDLINENQYLKQLDMMIILGAASYKKHDGLSFKNRGAYMGYKFKRNSLKVMAETMGLDVQKGGIDFNIFFKDEYTPQEEKKIKKYLKADVMATREMFEKVWAFYLPFIEFLYNEDILNLSWIKSSIASLTYKAACKVINAEPTYGNKPEDSKEKMGGRVIEPKFEEASNVWYVDFTSLYPHIFSMFNLFAEKDPNDCAGLWHGNKLFKVKGYYDITSHHLLAKDVGEKLKQRIQIKKEDPNNPLQYALKIFLNSLYGAARSPVFEKIYKPHCGWDCCWLGQQINYYTESRMQDFGFETIAGDTDSVFVQLIQKPQEINNFEEERNYVKTCLKIIVDEIKANVPFPAETFNIDIEAYINNVMWAFEEQPIEWTCRENVKSILEKYTDFSENQIEDILNYNTENTKVGHNTKGLNKRLIKVRRGKKKNYAYIYYKKDKKMIKIVGLPIKKDNATLLAPKIFHEVLEPIILDENRLKFSRSFINDLIDKYLNKPEALDLLSIEFKVKPANTYKNPSQIQAQISTGYFNGQDGVIRLIKNKSVGKAGKTAKYCTVEEAKVHKLGIRELDLTKVYNELEPFVKFEK